MDALTSLHYISGDKRFL